MWDLGAGRCLHSYRTHTGRIQGVEIIEDRLFAISLSSEDTCELWELSGEIHPVLAPYVLCRARNELFLDTACTGSHRDLLEKAKEALSTGDVQLSAESIRLARQDPQCQKDEELLDLWSSLYLKLPRMDLGGIYEGPVLKGHSAPVTALCVSEDCRLALSGSSDKTLRLWDVESGRTIQLFEGHTDEITSAGIDGSNIYALSGSADGTARLWDIPSGICLKTLEGHTDEVTSVTLTRDGRLAVTASGGSDGSIRIWETLTGSCVKVLNDKGGAVISTSLSLDERFLLAGNIDRSLLLWDIAAGKVLKSFQGSKKTILKVLMSEDARFAFSCEGGSSENTPDQIIQWDVGQERSHRAYSGHQGGVSAICLTGDGKFLFSGDGEGKIIAWDTTNGRRLKVLEAHAGRVHSLALFKDSRYLLSAGEDNLVKYWMIDWKLGDRGTAPWTDDARPFLDAFLTLHVPRGDFLPLDEDTPPGTAEGILTRKGEPVWTLEDFEDLLYGLACAGYGWMEPASVRRKLIEILSLRKRRQSPAIPAGVDFPRYQKVKSPPLPSRIDLPLPDRANGQPGDLPGEIPETSREDTAGPSAIPQESPWAKVENLPYFRKAHVSLAMGEEMPLLRGEHHFKAIRTAALSCDGSRAVSGGNDAILKLWNLQDGTFVMDMAGHKDIIYSAAFSPDGTRIISGSGDRTVRIWDALTGECLTCLEGHKRSVFGVAFSKGGRFALSGGEDHILKLWDVDSGRCLNNFAGHTGWVQSVCFSADGQLAVSASQDRNVKIWEIATGECLLTLRGHSGVLRSVNISDTGHIVSGSRDATVRIWELPSGKCIKTLQGHGKSVNSVCFSPDGKYVLSGAGEFFEAGEMKLWDVQEGTCLETLEQKAGVTSVTFSGDGLIAASGNALHEIKVWKLQWELKDHEPALWDEGVRPYLTNFLFTHTPMGKALPTGKEPSREDIKKYLNRSGAPRWSDEDFALLMHQLASRGYGYLKAEGIMKELKNMTGQVSGGMAVQGSHR
jgi:WD40 repeat protein